MSEPTISRIEFLKLLSGIIIIILFLYGFLPRISSAFGTMRANDTKKRTFDLDTFGVKKIYPSKDMGREWYIDMEHPIGDGVFDPQTEITRNSDGTWRVGSADKDDGYNGKYHVVMNVGTPRGQTEWRDVEITGYIRVEEAYDSGNDEDDTSDKAVLQWYARGGSHSNETPCEGTSLKCRIYSDGHVGWVKEIWHDGGYTQERDTSRPTNSIKGRWIGWKAVMYNMEREKKVKMEGYLDDTSSNEWRKVTEVTDGGEWYSEGDQFEEAECKKPRNYIVTNSGPIAAFRSDGVQWDFKYLSVREIKRG